MLVVDANVIVSALLKDGAARKALLNDKAPHLFAPEFIKQEILKYAGEYSKKLKASEPEIMKIVGELFDACKIEIVPRSDYSEFIQEAMQICPDKKDAPYFALALKLNCPVWSQDKALKKQSKVQVYSIHELASL